MSMFLNLFPMFLETLDGYQYIGEKHYDYP